MNKKVIWTAFSVLIALGVIILLMNNFQKKEPISTLNPPEEVPKKKEEQDNKNLENEDQSKEENGEIPEGMYQNPVFEPVFADPSIVRGNNGYIYAYGTEDDWGDGEGNKVAPVIRSKNLVDWEYIGGAFAENPTWKDGWVWAPDVSYFNGKYYMYYTKSTWGDQNPGIGVAVADDPEGPFEDHGKITDSSEMGGYAIDPMLFMENDTPYLFFGGITSGIFAIELDDDGLSTVGDRIDVIGPGYEAPYIIKHNDYYYFFGSNGSCCNGKDSSYNVGVGRSESLFGPYLNKQGQDMKYHHGEVILLGYIPIEEGKGQIAGPGHNAIFTDDAGIDWLVYHGIPADNPSLNSGATRRPLFIDRIEWVDGWPAIEESIPSITPKEAPTMRTKE